MKLKYILSTVLFIGFAHTSQAENHTLSPKLAKDFEMAVKNVENKNFLDAVKMFRQFTNGSLKEAKEEVERRAASEGWLRPDEQR